MKNKLKIFILTNSLKTGGAEKQSIYLTLALASKFDVKLIVYYGDQLDQRMFLLLKEVQEKVIWLKGNHITKLSKIYKLFRQNSNSVIISYLATTNFINAIIGTFSFIKIKIGGIRNSQFTTFKKLIQKFLHNYLLTYSVFNNYSGYKKLIKDGFNPRKASVIFNTLYIEKSPIIRKKSYNITILTIGRFVYQKDYKTAFKVLKRILQIIKNDYRIKYIVVGQGELENILKEYAIEIKINNNIDFIINPSNLSKYLELADIYISTSLYEGLSNSIMEAMEYSLPVVATNVGDNKELIVNGKNGFLTRIGDVVDISDKLINLIENYDLRVQMGSNGYKYLKEKFSMNIFRQKYIDLIERLVNEAKI